MNKQLIREIETNITLIDKYIYYLDKSFYIAHRSEYGCIGFYSNSVCAKKIDKNYFEKVNYNCLPKKDKYTNVELVWFKFTGKYMDLQFIIR